MRFDSFSGFLAVMTWLLCAACGGGESSGSAGEEGGASPDALVDASAEDVAGDGDTGSAPGDPISGEDAEAPEDVLDAASEDVPVVWPNIVINEVLVKADGNHPDWIELTSLHGETVDLGGWGIRDELNAHEYLLPEGTLLEAFSYKVIWGNGGNQDLTMEFGFKIAAKARLFTPDGTLADEADWDEGDAPAGTSWGRFPDGGDEVGMLDIAAARERCSSLCRVSCNGWSPV